jgi:anaerobic magnesium-protoporphyrin IX monomethyl ester cyclase
MLYHGPFSTEFYRQLHTVIHKEYRARKTWQHLGQLRPWRAGDVRQVAAMIYHTATLPAARAQLDALERSSRSSVISLTAT